MLNFRRGTKRLVVRIRMTKHNYFILGVMVLVCLNALNRVVPYANSPRTCKIKRYFRLEFLFTAL